MEIQGRVWKEGGHWLVEIPALDSMTQGATKKEALAMARDLVEQMLASYFEKKKAKVAIDCDGDILTVAAEDLGSLLSLVLIRQRERSGSTVREASERMGSRSPNAYAQYERGSISVSLEKYEELLMAANPKEGVRLRVV